MKLLKIILAGILQELDSDKIFELFKVLRLFFVFSSLVLKQSV